MMEKPNAGKFWLALGLAIAGSALLSPASSALQPTLGVNDIALRATTDPTRIEALADTAQDLGSSSGVPTRIWRMELGWSDVQAGSSPNPPFYWAQYDRIYNELRERGIKPLWTVMRAPNWARNALDLCPSAPAGNCPPDNGRLGDWQTFVRNVVLRYPESAGIEVWNEPNLKKFWGTWVNPARYVGVLATAYDGVQQAEQQLQASMPPGWSMPVLLGGAADPPSGGVWGELSRNDWVNAVYNAQGPARYFDVHSAHIYPNPQNVPPDQGWYPLLGELQELLDIRDARGDSAKPVWLTEVGFHTFGSDSGWGPPATPQQQGEFLRCSYGLFVDNSDKVDVFLINQLVDEETPPQNADDSWGLLANDLSFKAPAPNDGYTILQDYFLAAPPPITSCD